MSVNGRKRVTNQKSLNRIMKRLEAVKTLNEDCQWSQYTHAFMLDRTNLVDTWDADLRNPRKFRLSDAMVDGFNGKCT